MELLAHTGNKHVSKRYVGFSNPIHPCSNWMRKLSLNVVLNIDKKKIIQETYMVVFYIDVSEKVCKSVVLSKTMVLQPFHFVDQMFI